MKLVLAHLALEWNHLRRDRTAMMWTFLMPFAFMFFFGSVFSNDGAAENVKIRLAVRDDDKSVLSRSLVALLDTTRFVIAAADTGAPFRTLSIPAGFSDSVLAGHPVKVARIQTRGSEDAAFAADAGVVRALVKFHGALAFAAPDSGEWSDSTSARFAAAASTPSFVSVDSHWGGRGIGPSGFRQSVPGNLTVFVLMNTVIAASTLLVTEKNSGALRRAAAGPISRGTLLALRVVPRFLMALAQIALLLTGARIFFGYQPGHSPLAFLFVGAAFALVCVGLGTLFGALFSTVQQAAMGSWITCMLMAAIGGAWWPLEVVPSGLRTAAHALPTAWAMDGFHAVATYGGGFTEVLASVAVLLAMAAFLFALAQHFLRVDDR